MKFDTRRRLSGRGLLVTAVATGVLAAGGATAAFATAGAGGDGGGGAEPGERPAATSVSLAQAADAALKAAPGKIAEIELDGEHGRTVWEVDVLADDGTPRDVAVDAGNGKVTANRVDRPDQGDDDDGDGKAEAAALRNAKVTAPDAAATALKSVPGRVTSADFDREAGKAVWEVDVTAQNGTEHELTIDATTGKVLTKEVDED
ncbi:PepSY domain-containing protein [Actinomadura darangshiensis]|nr:PepSY domain-containing protein [Actinomadura darangshiensis]